MQNTISAHSYSNHDKIFVNVSLDIDKKMVIIILCKEKNFANKNNYGENYGRKKDFFGDSKRKN